MRPPPAAVVRYGDHPDQVANLHLPAGGDVPRACVVLVHGGFWKARWDRTLMTPLALDLVRRGFAVWNLEYRRVGQEGGGWPGTLLDVAAGFDALADAPEVDETRVVAVGHSAGGHLVLWIGARGRLPAGAPGAAPRVVPRAVVGQAAVCDLVAGARVGLGAGAVRELMGGDPDEMAERYGVASPAQLLPLGVTQVLVHGLRDDVVPSSLSRSYAAAASAAGDAVELLEPDADHFDVIDPAHPAWRVVAAKLPALLA